MPETSPNEPQAVRIFETLGLHFGQLGVVVDDIERAVAAHAVLGPWALYTYDRARVPGMHIRGRAADFSFRIALNPHRPQLELIQPLDDGNPYRTWLTEHGPGLHHLGFYVASVDAAIGTMEAAGFPTIMGGTGHGADGTGGYCYFDTVSTLGYIAEAIEVPVERHPPEATMPLPEATSLTPAGVSSPPVGRGDPHGS